MLFQTKAPAAAGAFSCRSDSVVVDAQLSQPPLRITAKPKKMVSRVQVTRFKVASALRALVNMELLIKPPCFLWVILG